MIAARNIGPQDSSENATDIAQLETFFTLHRQSKDNGTITISGNMFLLLWLFILKYADRNFC